jgi:hypothetical protein
VKVEGEIFGKQREQVGIEEVTREDSGVHMMKMHYIHDETY